MRPFVQVDVFGGDAYGGNPVAVVLDGQGLTDAEMQRFARWTNLSETTFVLRSDVADYRVRIFTTEQELPFAGHPTLGTCHAWLGSHQTGPPVTQECAAGIIAIRRTDAGLAFAAPPLARSGPVEEDLQRRIEAVLQTEIVATQWVDNGPGWVAALLPDAEAVLALEPEIPHGMFLGVCGPHPGGDLEVRAFFPGGEDPVTGSLNASLAQWLTASGRLSAPYIARQGTAIGRTGRVHISEADGQIWVAGATATRVTGTVDL